MTRDNRAWYWPYPRPELQPLPERTPGAIIKLSVQSKKLLIESLEQ